VATQRVATLRIGIFGSVEYQDGSLEYVNSSAIFQPSRLAMYWPAVFWAVLLTTFGAVAGGLGSGSGGVIGFLLGLVVGIAMAPLVVRLQYRIKKSGLVFWIREGLAVYLFIDRERIGFANQYYRLACELRDERLREIGHP
jgi:hypothetical protein